MSRVIIYKKDSCPYCFYLHEYINNIKSDYPNVSFDFRDPDPKMSVKGYPFSVFEKNGKKVGEMIGFNPQGFKEKVKELNKK